MYFITQTHDVTWTNRLGKKNKQITYIERVGIIILACNYNDEYTVVFIYDTFLIIVMQSFTFKNII